MQTVFVITVCWNAVNLIEETIKSVLSQTYQNVKYLIIDGGSTDGTVDIIRKYEDQLTYWVSEPDKGIYDAMNKGLAKCRELAEGSINHEKSIKNNQSWVNFMNAGDSFVDATTIEQVFSNKNLDFLRLKMIGGGTWNVFSDPAKTFLDPAKSPYVIPNEIPFSHQASFTKLDICKFDTRFKIAADYAIMYNLYFDEGPQSILSLDIPIAKYQKDDSFSTLNPKKAKGEYLAIQSRNRTWHWWKEYIKWRCF